MIHMPSARYGSLLVAKIENKVLWFSKPCSLVGGHGRFGGNYCVCTDDARLRSQAKEQRSHFRPEGGGKMFLRNVVTMSQP
jgi:hypothetical protein